MTVTLEIAPEVEQLVKARAEANGVSLESYLPSLIAQAAQQEEWEAVSKEESLGRLTMLAAEPVLSRIWNTPEEDSVWKYLEEDDGEV
jgi:hypothetical protein